MKKCIKTDNNVVKLYFVYGLVIYITLFPVFMHLFLTPFFPTLKISVPLCNTFPFSSPCSCVTPIGPPGGGGVSVFPSAPGGGGVPDFSKFLRIAPKIKNYDLTKIIFCSYFFAYTPTIKSKSVSNYPHHYQLFTGTPFH